MPDDRRISRGPLGQTRHGVRRPLPAPPAIDRGQVHAWHQRNRQVTLPHGMAMLEEYGNLDNLRRLTGETDADFRGMLFADSDIYKTLEAAAWEMGREADAGLRAFFDRTVDLIERAQQDDGYLDSAYLGRDDRLPWSDFAQGHELYCLGHLIQAAVAAHRAIADDRLLGVAERFVAHVVDRIGSDDAVEYCGHPLVEAALVELHRTTGAEAPLRLAEAFVRRRGAGFLGGVTFGAAYYQDEQPALQATTMRGHAVRALYLNQGITDLYLETGDPAMLDTIRTQWDDLVDRRMYVTGGTGARHEDEAFGEAFELPPDRAYAETCAGVALFGWAWRMYLATGAASCLDVAETALYNVVAAGISAHGDSFTYVNPLQVRDERPYGGAAPDARRRWFSCACCPPNLMRTFATLEHHLAAERTDGLDIALYASATVQAHGATVEIDTAYPADGLIRIRVHGDADDGCRRLALRVPGWATGESVTLSQNGVEIEPHIEDGWIVIDDALLDGTTLELRLPVQTTVIHPNPRIDAVRGTVAVRRGPVVYCAVGDVDGLTIDPASVAEARITAAESAQGSEGRIALGPRLELAAHRDAAASAPLYSSSASDPASTPVTVELRPFAEFDGGAAMRVWLPTA
ncbi:glycoside hydrolase family 127 protein [Microbacterium luteolum]|uniref:Glycoside hydrolase family 127 protein n=1 Tax=Microbacterium luteolum TaxID=69367 RepID=A0ABY7XRY4_MICLT|nr:beta-L-arabinofuranosidase domain-containing protein [Microbacterium luteolum]WDM44890.1 glycoside hydrolase family 127 protein [Microbacterium luteolum]